MGRDSVGRTDSVPKMGDFAGRQPDQPQSRQHGAPESEAGQTARGHDEVCVRSGAVAALGLLRERVLAATRRDLGIGQVSVPVFAEVFDSETVEAFLSRMISDYNQLAALVATDATPRSRLSDAFAAGLAETRELLAEVPGDGPAAVEQAAAEFVRRLAELDS